MQAPNIQPDVSVQDISSNVPVRGGQNTQRETASGTSFEQQLEKALKNTSDSPEYSDGQKAAGMPSVSDANPMVEIAKEITAGIQTKTVPGSDTATVNVKIDPSLLPNHVVNSDDSAVAILIEDVEPETVAENVTVAADETVALCPVDCMTDVPVSSVLLSEQQQEMPVRSVEQIKKGEKEQKSTRIRDDILLVAGQSVQTPAAVQVMPQELSEVSQVPRHGRLETGTALDDKIAVLDYRSAADNGVTETSLKDGNFISSVSYGDGTADIHLQLNSDRQNIPSSAGKASENRFASMLSSELQNNAADFVKNGSIILRDGNQGTINLILHPEQLGNVKISLKLQDKLVSAQILVASEEAYQAFRDSISSIKQAFADNGFQTGGFDLAWTGTGAGTQSQTQQQDFSRQQQFFSVGQTAYQEESTEDSESDLNFRQKMYSDSSRFAVNIIA